MKFNEGFKKTGKITKNIATGLGILAGVSGTVLNSSPVSAQNINNSEIEIDLTIKKEFEKQKEFMVNWFSNRIIPDSDLQKKYEEIKPHILKNLEIVYLKQSTFTHSDGTPSNVSSIWRNDTIFF